MVEKGSVQLVVREEEDYGSGGGGGVGVGQNKGRMAVGRSSEEEHPTAEVRG
jgi:hypothetical protein